MLIPSIDLQGGRVVQLVQGDRLALASDDLDGWIAKFKKFPKVQLIDLDAAMSRGNNDNLVKTIAAQLPCRVGGGVRTVRRAEERALIAAYLDELAARGVADYSPEAAWNDYRRALLMGFAVFLIGAAAEQPNARMGVVHQVGLARLAADHDERRRQASPPRDRPGRSARRGWQPPPQHRLRRRSARG